MLYFLFDIVFLITATLSVFLKITKYTKIVNKSEIIALTIISQKLPKSNLKLPIDSVVVIKLLTLISAVIQWVIIAMITTKINRKMLDFFPVMLYNMGTTHSNYINKVNGKTLFIINIINMT